MIVKCPPEIALREYIGKTADPDPGDAVVQHMESCTDCLQKLEHLSGKIMPGLRHVDAPDAYELPVQVLKTIYQIGGPDVDSTRTMPGKSSDHSNSVTVSLNSHEKFEKRDRYEPEFQIGQVLPRIFGNYELLEVIARGGMGVVFRALDTRLDRVVAVKQILDGRLADERAIRRFRSESRIAASLHHAGIVPIYDVGEVDGQHFFSMPLVEGVPLSALISNGPLDPHRAARIVCELATAMQHAHENGVLHRDLKPGNVLMSDQQPQITDFGLARTVSDGSQLTSTGRLVGTPAYMAPEQVRGQDDLLGPHTDVYAMGVMLYEMLSGRPPFQAAEQWQTLARIVREDPIPLLRLNPSLPRNLAAICEKCLSKSIDRRYPSAQLLADDLTRFLEGRAVLARPISPAERFWRLCLRNQAQSAAALATLLLAVTLAVLLIWSQFAEQRQQQALQQLELLQQSIDTERFFSTVSKVREALRSTDPEEHSRSLEQLESIRVLAVTPAQQVEVRSLMMQALGRPGLTKIATLGEGFPPARIQFSPDGRWLAIGELHCGGSPRILLVDVNTQEIRHTLVAVCEDDDGHVPPASDDDHYNGVRTIEFERNGTRLMVGLRDGSVHLWDTYDNGPQGHRWFQAHNGWVNGAAFTHRNDIVVSWSTKTDHSICRWQVQADGSWLKTGKVVSVQDAGEPGIAVGNSGQTLFVVHERELLTEKIDDFTDLHKMAFAGQSGSDMHFGGSGLSLTVSADGRFIAGQRFAEISVVCAESGHRLVDLTDPSLVDAAHQSEVYSLAFHPTEPWLISTGSDQRVKLWDFASGELLLSFVVPGDGLVTAKFSPNGRYVAVTGLKQTLLMRLEGLDSAYSLGLSREVIHAVTNDRSRSRIATLSETIVPDYVRLGDVAVSDIATRSTIFSKNLTGLLDVAPVYPPAICLSPNGHWLAYHGRSTQCLLQDLQSGKHQLLIETNMPRTMTMDDDHVWLVYEEREPSKVVGPGPQIASFAVSDHQKKVHIANSRAELESRVSYIRQLLLTQHGLLIASRDGSVLLVDRSDGHEILSWRGRTVATRSMTVSGDESLLAVGYQDGTIDVHALPSCEKLTSWTAHRDMIDALSFSADGRRLLSGANTGTVRLWQESPDANNYELIMNITENRRPVTWAMLDAKGETAHVHFLKERAIRCYEFNEALGDFDTPLDTVQTLSDGIVKDSR